MTASELRRDAEISELTTPRTGFVIAGWLLPSADDCVRLLVENDVYLVLTRESVDEIAVEEAAGPDPSLLRVRLHLSSRPILLELGPGAPLRGFFRLHPRPFALTARTAKPTMIGHEIYLEKEAAYFRRHGLVHHRTEQV